jgi:hypothetical protein
VRVARRSESGWVCVRVVRRRSALLSESDWVCVRVARRRSELLCSGAFSLGSVLGHNNGVAFLWGPFRGPVGGQMWRFLWSPYFRNASYLEELRLLNSDQRNLWRVKLQDGQQLRVSKFCE